MWQNRTAIPQPVVLKSRGIGGQLLPGLTLPAFTSALSAQPSVLKSRFPLLPRLLTCLRLPLGQCPPRTPIHLHVAFPPVRLNAACDLWPSSSRTHPGCVIWHWRNADSPQPRRKQTLLIYAWLLFGFFFIPRHNSDFSVPSTPHQYPFTASKRKQRVNISFPIPSPPKRFCQSRLTRHGPG